jgi:putative radical SAM enzyme (TIGR03279 family)
MILNESKNVNVISRIISGSIAADLGLVPGDRLLSINGQQVEDVIDYRYLSSDEHLEVTLIKSDGSEWILEIEKEFDEELGIEFENPVMAETRQCSNKCVFCFIDQMPPGMRPGLYIKDDDSRLSFLQGNYITLTNMKSKEIDKLVNYHISPLNISVHTTNPELRVKILHNRLAGKLMTHLQRFHENRIHMNLQIVLCPGFNDGQELERTLSDLESIADSLISIAVVPVGLTKYQKNKALLPIDKRMALETVRQITTWQERWMDLFGRKLVYPSDEFYLQAHLPWPKADEYEAFYQLENGVGMLASFEKDFLKYMKKIPLIRKRTPFTLTIATGTAAASFMRQLAQHVMEKIDGLTIQVIPVENHFFGQLITVSGLITGQDLVSQLKDNHLGNLVMIPANMLKSDESVFLDDMTLDQVTEALQVSVQASAVDGRQWMKNILRSAHEKQTGRSEKKYGKTSCGCHWSSKCR